MAAYVIVDIEVKDRERYAEYVRLSPVSLAQYGGRFVVRGGRHEALEGDWRPNRLVVLEFESVERAKEWWASAEYADAKRLRQATASSNMIVVEGV